MSVWIKTDTLKKNKVNTCKKKKKKNEVNRQEYIFLQSNFNESSPGVNSGFYCICGTRSRVEHNIKGKRPQWGHFFLVYLLKYNERSF